MNILDIIFIVTGIISIILAIVAIIMSIKSEKRSTESFSKTQQLIDDMKKDIAHYEEISDRVLAEIDKKTDRIEQISVDTKTDVHNNVNRVFESNFPSPEQQYQSQATNLLGSLLGLAFQNPDVLAQLIEAGKQNPNK